jgi:hypothetical protein
MLSTHIDAEQRYTAIRKSTLNVAQSKLVSRAEYSSLKLKLIDSSALSASAVWENISTRRVNWNWIDGYAAFKFRYPKRFELAIWSNNKLQSLTLGRPTYNGTALRLDYVEASPSKDKDLRVVPAALFVMITYAEALGANELRIMNPINEEVKKYYESLGLIYVAIDDYLYIGL